MGVEIERKYLVNKNNWDKLIKDDRHFIKQGYIINSPGKTIRVRLTDNKGYITIKGVSTGASRPEFEYEIPEDDAKQLLDNFCTSAISKIRNNIIYNGKFWQVDEFLEDNEGLIIAEIELADIDEAFDLPVWITKEVTGEEKYYNSYLSVHPFKEWRK
ncbi:CYTH domain-containing protein [Segetibacter koreensis]|uniref:CYTH domain-containing protein n=1 Tax=Segetibacter koreensis TaxID=398037 RepID=UPI00037A2DCE|nr:CYTH domain-containing protein [Segetibacter koreensis]